MTTIAGVTQNLKRLARTITDSNTRIAMLDLENKVLELDKRLIATEARLKAGGL